VASTGHERVIEIYHSYSDAYARRPRDLADATTQAQATQILANGATLEAGYLEAARDALDATGAAVEQAYQDAVAARVAVNAAYQNAQALTAKIALVTAICGKVSDLVKTASGKG
jgi:hypothetical protein